MAWGTWQPKKKRQTFQKIGQYLGCDEKTLRMALQGQRKVSGSRKKIHIGEILLNNGSITPAELEGALAKQYLERLSGCSIFDGLSMAELAEISRWVSEVSVEAGVEFISQDQPGDCLYILVDGDVSVYRYGDYSEEIPLYRAKPGDAIGETGYFSDGRRLAAVKTEAPSQFLKIKYEDLDTIFKRAETETHCATSFCINAEPLLPVLHPKNGMGPGISAPDRKSRKAAFLKTLLAIFFVQHRGIIQTFEAGSLS